jgi:hypothetical protein
MPSSLVIIKCASVCPLRFSKTVRSLAVHLQKKWRTLETPTLQMPAARGPLPDGAQVRCCPSDAFQCTVSTLTPLLLIPALLAQVVRVPDAFLAAMKASV